MQDLINKSTRATFIRFATAQKTAWTVLMSPTANTVPTSFVVGHTFERRRTLHRQTASGHSACATESRTVVMAPMKAAATSGRNGRTGVNVGLRPNRAQE